MDGRPQDKRAHIDTAARAHIDTTARAQRTLRHARPAGGLNCREPDGAHAMLRPRTPRAPAASARTRRDAGQVPRGVTGELGQPAGLPSTRPQRDGNRHSRTRARSAIGIIGAQGAAHAALTPCCQGPPARRASCKAPTRARPARGWVPRGGRSPRGARARITLTCPRAPVMYPGARAPIRDRNHRGRGLRHSTTDGPAHARVNTVPHARPARGRVPRSGPLGRPPTAG